MANWTGIFGDLGSVFGSASRGSENSRLSQDEINLRNQALRQQGARDRFSAGTESARFAREAEDRKRKAAVLSQLLNNTTDQQITPGNPNIAARMPTVTGGARPSNLTGGNREALLALLAAEEPQAPRYQAPPNREFAEAGGLEKTLGGLGLGSSVLGVLGKLLPFLGGGGGNGVSSSRAPGSWNINSGLYDAPGDVYSGSNQLDPSDPARRW